MEWLDCTKDVVIHAACGAAPAVGVAPAVRADPAEGPAAPEAVDKPAEHLHHQHQGMIKMLCATRGNAKPLRAAAPHGTTRRHMLQLYDGQLPT